ncbi:bifunctional lysylphosphatidylglycerol flippase/synthetase MprF [Methylomonas rapida]|uniref:Bifunctional lysylphosphatidylglycerol flippase/synthetase MprF n=1 Tax=Methylomonas rapida TaxID=2963939 RepID=A0ABY7GGD9_9GAMM|nr:bifunctional lysylphosphatidylglycerol flippase/synthetase MprF [Methylomonas rapida]WAR44347.1 bifunctional lysylphosphatidylglycerol flippase/synthetase MprF [Methylomonas rapida]
MIRRTGFCHALRKISYFLPLALFACALVIVHNELKIHGLDEIMANLQATPRLQVLAALALTVLNYLVLAAYDWLALRFTGHADIPLPKMIAAALLSYAISNNTGHAWAAGGSVRYRFYSKWGVPGWDILKISLFQAITYLLGALTLGLIGSLLLPLFLPPSNSQPAIIHWITAICALSLAGYWLAVLLWRRPIRLQGFELCLPSATMTSWQTLVACVDVVLSSWVLWVLLVGKLELGFAGFLVVFVVAQVIGVISQVPGGIGVFESGFLWLLSDSIDQDEHLFVVGALLLYRAIYYFVPLMLAGLGLIGNELYARRPMLTAAADNLGRLLTAVLPQLYSVLLLLAGGILLLSGSIPTNPDVMDWLRDIVPLPVMELSHLTGSLAGLLLIFLARGIRLKIDTAWHGSVILLSIGILASLLKGFDWHEALVLTLILLLFIPCRGHFSRPSSLWHMPFSRYWLAMIALILATTVWLGFFAHRDTAYAHELWWQFSTEGSAPRFLRATLLLAVITSCYILFRLFGVAQPFTLRKPDADELDEAQRLIAQGSDCQGFLALLGDKYLFWSAKRSAFLMFTTISQYWIAMGDPIGEPREFEELLWQFREQADHYGVATVFYQVNEKLLPVYLDLGLSLFKLGEEAKVDLWEFSLKGKQRESQRGALNKFTKLNYRFEILPGPDVPAILPRLQRISDDWLSGKRTQEKGFSLGFFDPTYLCRTPIAVVKDDKGQIRAFANLWQTDNREEISIDLMRYDQDSPKGIMDYLFTELMLWAQSQQYRWFSLGMAPLAGLERRPLAPLWHKIGNVIFDLAGEFYHFEGLYAYKAKFAPSWRPRFLAAPAGLSVPLILLSIARKIAGGWIGIFGNRSHGSSHSIDT